MTPDNLRFNCRESVSKQTSPSWLPSNIVDKTGQSEKKSQNKTKASAQRDESPADEITGSITRTYLEFRNHRTAEFKLRATP